MGTGVGEAALAAEAVGTAGAVAGGAGLAEAGLLGGEYAGGLGLTGGLTGGLGSAAALGGEYGGLSSLAPAFQQATAATAALNPETAAQTMQAANVGAVPSANTALGAGQIGSDQVLQAFQNAPTSSQLAAQYGPGTQVAAAPGVGADTVMGDVLSKGSRSIYDLGATDMSLGAAGQANAAAAATPSVTQAAGAAFDPSTMATINQGAGDIAAKSGLPNPFTSAYNLFMEQDKPTRYGLGALGAMQAAKYLNKPQSVAAAEKYNGPLSKFRYDPSAYTPYTYKSYAGGGPVEQMSNANAVGANTGFPMANIHRGAYSTPYQQPISRNVVFDAGDTGVDQMTGQERMAEGGIAKTASEMPAVAASQQNFSDFLSRYQGAPEQAGLAALTATEKSLPAIAASRQNFADFLARYQNMPVTQAAPQPAQYQGLYYTPPGASAPAPAPDAASTPYTGDPVGAAGGLTYSMAGGGIANLGSYSDGGRLLRGPGDGMSDNIPANISGKQPARLADGEFVVPADVVSGLGNGSTDAGAKQLYKMLDKVRSARTGTKKQGKQINPNKYTPA